MTQRLFEGLLQMVFWVLYAGVFTRGLERKKDFPRRAAAGITVLFGAAAVLPLLLPDADWSATLEDVLLWLLLVRVLASCYREKRVLYYFWALMSLAAYGWSESLYTVILCWISPAVPFSTLLRIALAFASGCMVYQLIGGKNERPHEGRDNNRTFYVVVVLLLVMFAIESMGESTLLSPAKDEIFFALLSFLGILLLYIFFITYRMRTNYEVLQELIDKDAIRYEKSKEYTDLINMKFHDLKHQLHKWERDERMDREYVRELEEAIRVYDSDIKTGNEALDIIFTEKNQEALARGIEATFMADGALLDFMKPSDLYSLFGNILDNAIEALDELSVREMKQLSLVVAQEAGVIRIREQNYFSGTLRQEADGTLLSTKGDEFYHGFGTKSIQYIAEKYGGAVHVQAQGELFIMNILIPCAGA